MKGHTTRHHTWRTKLKYVTRSITVRSTTTVLLRYPAVSSLYVGTLHLLLHRRPLSLRGHRLCCVESSSQVHARRHARTVRALLSMPPPAFFLLGAVTSPRSRGARAAAAVASHRTSTWLPSSLHASSSAFAKSSFSTTSTTSLSPSSPHKPPGPLPPLGGLKPPLPPLKQPASPPGAFPFVPCGEGFTSATATPGNSSSFSVYSSWGWGHESLRNGGSSRAAISRRGEEEGDKEEDDHARPLEPGRKSRIVALADCGHGVGRALLAALLEYPDTPSIVAAATTSEELTSSLR